MQKKSTERTVTVCTQLCCLWKEHLVCSDLGATLITLQALQTTESVAKSSLRIDSLGNTSDIHDKEMAIFIEPEVHSNCLSVSSLEITVLGYVCGLCQETDFQASLKDRPNSVDKSALSYHLDYRMQPALGPLIMKRPQVPEKNFHFQNTHGTHVVKLNSSNFKVYKFINIYGVGLQSFTGDAIIIWSYFLWVNFKV